MMIERLRRALHERRPVRDEDFDAIYPLRYRQVSAQYWTPVETVRCAADLLVGARRVLDVGAGVGKFCLVGAASAPWARFVGLEQREHLVAAAREAARSLRAERVEILHGRLGDIDTSAFDAFYFYNPFAENLMGSTRLGDDLRLSRRRYEADVRHALAALVAAPTGTRVVTYYGYGGAMPPEYELVHAERRHSGALQLWIKKRPFGAREITSRALP